MKIWKAYEEIKKKAGVKRVNPENVSRLREVLSSLSSVEMAKRHGMKSQRSVRYLNSVLFRFFRNPTVKQKILLYYLFKKSKPPTSLKAIQKKLGLTRSRYPYSCDYLLSARILEDMELIQLATVFKGHQRFSIITINHQRFKKYWSDIEDWGSFKVSQKGRSVKEKAKKGEQIKRAFKILSEELKEKGEKFSPEVIEIIKKLTRGDFYERGWKITPRYLSKLKRRLLKMPIVKFISHLEEAEESRLFLFTQ